jgi:hypothetical protein
MRRRKGGAYVKLFCPPRSVILYNQQLHVAAAPKEFGYPKGFLGGAVEFFPLTFILY